MFFSAVVYEAHGEQKLECPYTPENRNLNRVWCKREANNASCCTGFSFMSGSREGKDTHMSVQDNGSAFTVTMTSLPQGDGVYWCGLSDTPNTIIKLAEKRFYSESDQISFVISVLLNTAERSSRSHCSSPRTQIVPLNKK